jgi:hypothetical protein
MVNMYGTRAIGASNEITGTGRRDIGNKEKMAGTGSGDIGINKAVEFFLRKIELFTKPFQIYKSKKNWHIIYTIFFLK